VKEERSAGGVLVRKNGDGLEVCLVLIETRGGNPTWRLPKGWIEPDETREQAAVRETREETGCLGNILSELGEIDYWYTQGPRSDRERVHKIVVYFLLEYEDGSTNDHDHEVVEAAWFPLKQGASKLAYDGERRMLLQAEDAWRAHLYRMGF
jgi:8-oxo-dGTP pyrophosphatase MutT (NUDIX family)